MFGRLLCGLGLTALVLVAPSIADGNGDGGGANAQIECGQSTAPLEMAGRIAIAGPYATQQAAIAAAGKKGTQAQAIASTFWPSFSCPGCPDGAPGCDELLVGVEATTGGAQLRQGANGWYVDYHYTGGAVAMNCDICPAPPAD